MINDYEKSQKTLSFERIQYTAWNNKTARKAWARPSCTRPEQLAPAFACFCFIPTPFLPKPAWVKQFSDQSTCDLACASSTLLLASCWPWSWRLPPTVAKLLLLQCRLWDQQFNKLWSSFFVWLTMSWLLPDSTTLLGVLDYILVLVIALPHRF